MALVFFDGFETYATADILKDWTGISGSPAIASTSGRRGGRCLSTAIAYHVFKTLSSSYSSIVIGFAFNPSKTDLNSISIAELRDGGSKQLEIKFNTDATLSITRNGTVLGTSSAALTTGNWQYIELKATIHDTTGSYELRLDGVNILSATGVDTKNTANASVNQIYLGPTLITGSTYLYDDFYALNTTGSAPNNNFLGDVRVDAIYPNADGTYTQWTPSTGTSHYALVDEATPSSADYNYDSTAGNKDSYEMGSLPTLSNQTIHGVRVKVAALKDDAGARSLKVGVRSNTTDSLSSVQALTTSEVYYSSIHETDPNTAAAWTESGVNAMQVVVETV